jgi:NAD(P)-dependent dehydrogenase (short-subunit alcohol dehydrogenase family)
MPLLCLNFPISMGSVTCECKAPISEQMLHLALRHVRGAVSTTHIRKSTDRTIRADKQAELDEDLYSTFKTNVVGNIHLFNVFMPLILKGDKKKVIAISSGMADDSLTNKYAIEGGAPYSISKAAMNTAIAKFNAQYAEQGVLFMSICPGFVNTGQNDNRELLLLQDQRFVSIGSR